MSVYVEVAFEPDAEEAETDSGAEGQSAAAAMAAAAMDVRSAAKPWAAAADGRERARGAETAAWSTHWRRDEEGGRQGDSASPPRAPRKGERRQAVATASQAKADAVL